MTSAMNNIIQVATTVLGNVQGTVGAHLTTLNTIGSRLTDIASVQASTTFLRNIQSTPGAQPVTLATLSNVNPLIIPSLLLTFLPMLIPGLWILRPVLGFLGFGLLGPVKGSAAAWLQSWFWGGKVATGSWFALLQAAGMGVIPTWVGFAIKAPLVGSLLAMVLSRFSRA